MIKQNFKKPGNLYKPVPFWFWNYYLDDGIIKFQIDRMKEKGLPGFFIHARHGLNVPYLSEEWFHKCLIALEEAEKLGMKAWIYDEDNWPSGTSGGEVIRKHPEYMASFVTVAKNINMSGPEKVLLNIDVQDGLLLLAAFKIKGRDRIVDFPSGAIDLKPYLTGNRLRWRVPPGDWKILSIAKQIYRGLVWGGEEKNLRRGYLDVLNKKAVRSFIETTHGRYIKRFKKYIPETIPGFFIDEPSMNYSNTNDYNWNCSGLKAVPWTDCMPEKFLQAAGYKLEDVLPGLFFDVGGKTGKIRCDYYETVTALYSENFFRQIYDYCRTNNLLSIGHVIAEGELFMQVRNQGDYFRVTEHMHYAGCDQLADQTWPEGIFHTNNLTAPKFASSAGHLLNKPRVMSESYGLANGWGLSLRTIKKLTDWQVALGVNFFIPHALYHSIFGFRKWDCPPSHYQATFWEYYRLYVDYTARLCSVFSGGRHIAKAAVLSPVKSIWSLMNPDDNPLIKKTCGDFNRLSTFLLRHHCDFDYLNEEILQKSRIENRRLKFFGEDGKLTEEFEALILPCVSTLSLKTVEKIEKFAGQGGFIIATSRLPDTSTENGSDRMLAKRIEDVFKNERCVFIENPFGKGGRTVLEKVLAENLEPDVIIRNKKGTAENIICLHYLKDGRDFYYLVNTSETEKQSVEAILNTTGTVEIWNTVNGEITAYPSRFIDGRIHVGLEFDKIQSYLISVDSREEFSAETGKVLPLRSSRPVFSLALKGLWNFSTMKPNALPLREWRYITSGRIMPVSNFPLGVHSYETVFNVQDVPDSLGILLDGLLIDRIHYACPSLRESTEHGIQVFVNGRKVLKWKNGNYLDYYIKEMDISGMIHKGENVIAVETLSELFETPNLTDPVILTGNFRLCFKNKKPFLTGETGTVKKGSWTNHGYPYYSGTARYRKLFNVPADSAWKRTVLVMDDVADMAEVSVNGKEIAVLPWPPYEVDITEVLKKGRNEVVLKITNSLQNLLTGEKKHSGLLGNARIDFYL